MNLEREQILDGLRRATDPRGFQPHELAAVLGAGAKASHRVRTLLAHLLDEGAVEKTEGARYRVVGWKPAPPPLPSLRPKGGASGGASGQQLSPRPLRSGKKPGKPVPAGLVSGRIRVHPAGYGFVERDDAEGDVFVPARHRAGALDGDRVALETWMGWKGTEGRVVEVLDRGRARITGTIKRAGRNVYLAPDDPRILGHVGLDGGAGGADDGQAVVAEIVEYPTEVEGPLLARVVKVLGDPDDPRTEVAKVIACAEIPDEFPDEVVQAAERTPKQVGIEDEIDRVDLRDRDFLTIDPETARDFDDAVCVEPGPRPGIERLWVAVADVSHYVRPGTALDREARARGCSVYLPDRAVPMLPHALSSGICSLNPEVDRLAMVVRLDYDEHARVVDAAFQAAVIRSRARLDYGGVAAALAGDLRGPRARYADHLPHLQRVRALAKRLRVLRMQRGSLDFDIPEPVVLLDEDDPRRVRDVRRSRSIPEVREAYGVIEDCMLAANEAVARFFRHRGLDVLWRIHDVPKEERLLEFAALAESYGVAFSADDARSPKKLRDFLESLKGRPMERPLSYLLLRALKQAVYDVVNVGHFGLAAPEYLHFTSPIRRYPDSVVHRLLKNQLKAEGLPAGGVKFVPPPPAEEMHHWAVESSSHERRAMEAEREVVDMYRAFLMRDRIGEEYDGTITGVTNFGIFVQIDEPFVEGLVKVERLGPDRFHFDEGAVRLVGERSGRAFALGDAARVRIENVSVPRRRIDLELVEHARRAPAIGEVIAKPERRRRESGYKGGKGGRRKRR